jgi:hypothetical protein
VGSSSDTLAALQRPNLKKSVNQRSTAIQDVFWAQLPDSDFLPTAGGSSEHRQFFGVAVLFYSPKVWPGIGAEPRPPPLLPAGRDWQVFFLR